MKHQQHRATASKSRKLVFLAAMALATLGISPAFAGPMLTSPDPFTITDPFAAPAQAIFLDLDFLQDDSTSTKLVFSAKLSHSQSTAYTLGLYHLSGPDLAAAGRTITNSYNTTVATSADQPNWTTWGIQHAPDPHDGFSFYTIAFELDSAITEGGSFEGYFSIDNSGYGGGASFTVTNVASVPEPSSLLLIGIGCLGLCLSNRRRKYLS